METWYRARFDKLEAVEIVRHTNDFVILPRDDRGKERREAKVSEWSNYFVTWQEAHDYLMAQAQSKVDSLRVQLQRANGALGNIKGMEPPLSK